MSTLVPVTTYSFQDSALGCCLCPTHHVAEILNCSSFEILLKSSIFFTLTSFCFSTNESHCIARLEMPSEKRKGTRGRRRDRD
jgi:hypothetical protein